MNGGGRARRLTRALGTILVALGLLGGGWVILVWQWKDPFTSLYTVWKQHELRGEYRARADHWRAPPPARGRNALASLRIDIAAAARRYRLDSHEGEAIGKIRVPRIGVDMILVNGTDEGSLAKGPGRDVQTYMPGEGELVYIAGHRTTYLAPFADIDRLRRGDEISLELPYGLFEYAVTGHAVVPAGDLARLRTHGRETVVLQACHPRFFATNRYLVYARPVSVTLAHGRVYAYGRHGLEARPADPARAGARVVVHVIGGEIRPLSAIRMPRQE